jgi:S1-C subfamily serine protease
MESILKDGQVTRGWMGVEPQNLNAELAEAFGIAPRKAVIITGVMQNGPADHAGIKPGDVVEHINGQAVATVAELLNQVAALKPNESAPIKVQRKGQTLTLQLVAGKRPAQRKQPQ